MYTKHKCLKHVFTLISDLTAFSLVNSIPLKTTFIGKIIMVFRKSYLVKDCPIDVYKL